MADANIVAFDPGLRVRPAAPIRHVVDEAELALRQQTVPLEDCHVAFERITVTIKLKKRSFTLFHDLSVVFPKGRKIVVLGHKGSGKTTLIDLALRRRAPNKGSVFGTSRLSFPIARSDFIDLKQTVRDNLMFVSRVLDLDYKRLTYAVQRFCSLNDKQLRTKVKEISGNTRRRLGLMIALAADFDCHLIDGALLMKQFGADGEDAEAIEGAVFGRDYICALSTLKNVPDNADLAYILYNGRLYYFDDIKLAMDVFAALPVPEDPGAGERKQEGDEDDDAGDEAVYY